MPEWAKRIGRIYRGLLYVVVFLFWFVSLLILYALARSQADEAPHRATFDRAP